MTSRPILLPTLPVVRLCSCRFHAVSFPVHLFSLFFQKRKSSSSVQLMVSVCRLPKRPVNPGPRTLRSCLPPAGCNGNLGRERGLRGVAWYVCLSVIHMCVVCACCWCVSVGQSNSMAQASSLTADLGTPLEAKVDLNPIPHPKSVASRFSPPWLWNSAQGLVCASCGCQRLGRAGKLWRLC